VEEGDGASTERVDEVFGHSTATSSSLIPRDATIIVPWSMPEHRGTLFMDNVAMKSFEKLETVESGVPEKAVYRCRACGFKGTMEFFGVQTRRGDESESFKLSCPKCSGKKTDK
jgi:DNA-directed RNA polymerase subunit M/transcription elongation factor TFIIS